MSPPLPPPTPGNITSVSTPQQMFPVIAQSLGIDPLILFGALFFIPLMGLVYLKVGKGFISFAILAYCFFGVYIGIVPFWVMIIGFTFFTITTASSFFKFFSGDYDSKYTFNYDDWKPTKIEVEEEHKTENCKNCGGPNVDRITCEWCGLVLE